MKSAICAAGLLAMLSAVFTVSCEKRTDVSNSPMAAITKRGAIHDNDPYWNPHLTVAQQNTEAQVLALLMLVLSTDKSATDFVQSAGDPDHFTSTDKLLTEVYKADPSHTVYRKVRAYLLSAGMADKYAQYAHDFRYNVFKPLSSAVLATKDDPYPDNICPTAATVCDASNGLSLACSVH